MGFAVAASVTLFFLVCAGWAGTVAVSAIRTGVFAPELGLELRGWGATVAGWCALVFAAALFGAGVLVWFVALRG